MLPAHPLKAETVSARYAIYYAPDPSAALWHFGAEVLGYDAATGVEVPFLDEAPFDRPDWLELTEEPRRYGFHATLKAPFGLADGFDEGDLVAAALDFAAARSRFNVPEMDVAALGRFVALVPRTPSYALETLAGDCVRAFEPFRAPLSPADLERRLAAPLNEREVRHLHDWGYPYVFEDFRFHLTLTGGLPEREIEPIRDLLERRYRAVPPGLQVDSIAVFRQQRRDGRFTLLERYPFGL